MSHVILLAAGRELPLLDHERETRYEDFRITFSNGIRVLPHEYYRWAVDILGYEMAPYQYELDVVLHENDWRSLVDYLRDQLAPGETVELWSLWVGEGGGELPRRSRGKLSEFDLDALSTLTEPQHEPDPAGGSPEGRISQICLTVEMDLPRIPALMTLEQLTGHDVYEFACAHRCAHRYPDHWSADSRYLADGVWGIEDLVPDLSQVFPFPSFDWFGPNKITLDQWDRVEALALARRPALEPFFRSVRAWLAQENRGAGHFWILGP